MKLNLRHLALATTVFAVAAACSMPSLAQDARSEDMVRFFKMDKIDANKDGMVSRKEFLDAAAKAWDMHMADAKKMEADKMGTDKMGADKMGAMKKADPMMKDKMNLEQYLEFSKMFGLNIGG